MSFEFIDKRFMPLYLFVCLFFPYLCCFCLVVVAVFGCLALSSGMRSFSNPVFVDVFRQGYRSGMLQKLPGL